MRGGVEIFFILATGTLMAEDQVLRHGGGGARQSLATPGLVYMSGMELSQHNGRKSRR